ncbi:hypothetical protein RJ640_000756 [Escallonia rubra]|uniref:DUF2470 domain-containing protein n=1 Tax=Escallonia rubra TaxID=112253 RepID=A0AA88U618_9ASTE|nr:hypothetical protein RJ640_000756 [Escallonia rubra]
MMFQSHCTFSYVLRIKTSLSVSSLRCENPLFGETRVHWLPLGREICVSKVSVAADYSDSVPDSSNYVSDKGYHPLEELKDHKRVRDTKLASAVIAKTAVEASSSALLIFPGSVHCEPHEHISWAEFQYVIDDYGDIYFEISDDENILQDRGASNPVNALIGMDIPPFENRRVEVGEYSSSESGSSEDIAMNEDYFLVEDSEIFDMPVEWGTPDTSSRIHPIYFAKCLTKAVNMEYAKKMDHPSNGVSILGCLRPTFLDEELYLRKLFNGDDSYGYTSDWKDEELLNIHNNSDGSCIGSSIYRLEIMRIELTSLYGAQAWFLMRTKLLFSSATIIICSSFTSRGPFFHCLRDGSLLGQRFISSVFQQSAIRWQDFKDAEPDILVHSTPALVEQFSQPEMKSSFALRALCKKKGLQVEGAKLIGVDSLGMDVRVFSGREVRTHRFPFKVRARSAGAAEKQIQQLLFPRSCRKKLRSRSDGLGDSSSF